MTRSRDRAARLTRATLEAQAATWAVLGMRVPALLNGTMSPAESRRMVDEKVAAAVESTEAVARMATRQAARGPRRLTPASALAGWLALAEAASRPYHARVGANAKRLRKGRKLPSA